MIIMLLIWGAGLGALYYLWRPESKPILQAAGTVTGGVITVT